MESPEDKINSSIEELDKSLTPSNAKTEELSSSQINTRIRSRSANSSTPVSRKITFETPKKPTTNRKGHLQGTKLLTIPEAEKRNLNTEEVLDQLVGHLKRHTKDNPSLAEDFCELLAQKLKIQNDKFDSYIQQYPSSKYSQEIATLLNDFSSNTTAKQLFAKAKILNSLTQSPKTNILVQLINQMINGYRQHTKNGNALADNYRQQIKDLLIRRNNFVLLLTENNALSLSPQQEGGAVSLCISSPEISTSTSLSALQSQLLEDNDITKNHTSQEVPQQIEDIGGTPQNTNHNGEHTNEVNTSLHGNQITQQDSEHKLQVLERELQIQKDEIAQLKHQLSEKEEIISNLQTQLNHLQNPKTSPSQLKNNVTKNLQLLELHTSTDEHYRGLIQDLSSNLNQLLNIAENESTKFRDMREEFARQQDYIEQLHLQQDASAALRSQIQSLLDEQTKTITSLLKGTQPQAPPSFARALGSKVEETLIVRRKDSSLPLTELERNIHNLGVEEQAIKDCFRTRNGNLQVRCKAEAASQIKEKILNSNLKEKVDVKQKRQRVIIFSIPKEVTEEDLLNSIRKKTNEQADIKLIKTTMNKDYYHQSLELDLSSATFLLSQRKLLIHMHSCPIRKYISLPRCYKCQALGHVAIQCNRNNVTRCEHCADAHDSRSCPHKEDTTKHKCYNCLMHNQSSSSKIQTNHKSSSPHCPTYLKKLNEKRSSQQNSK